MSKIRTNNRDSTQVSLVKLMESAEDKVNKPSDNVITSEEKPSTPTSTLITLGLLTIGLLFASLYFGILNP